MTVHQLKVPWFSFRDYGRSNVTDTRPSFLSLGKTIIECLNERCVERVRIGITEFANMAAYPDLMISHDTFMKIRSAFLHTDLLDVTV